MNKIKEKVLESLNAWHSDKVRGHKVYFADAVERALDEIFAEVGEVILEFDWFEYINNNGDVDWEDLEEG